MYCIDIYHRTNCIATAPRAGIQIERDESVGSDSSYHFGTVLKTQFQHVFLS
jgi:hypothetical protein